MCTEFTFCRCFDLPLCQPRYKCWTVILCIPIYFETYQQVNLLSFNLVHCASKIKSRFKYDFFNRSILLPAILGVGVGVGVGVVVFCFSTPTPTPTPTLKMKWVMGGKDGIVVAGGQGYGKDLTQLSYPHGVRVDVTGNVYVADWGNNRVMRWCHGATQGTVVVGGNGSGNGANQFSGPVGLSFDRHGHLYVSDVYNHRVQRFSLEKNWIKNISLSLSLWIGLNTYLRARATRKPFLVVWSRRAEVSHARIGQVHWRQRETQQWIRQGPSCATVTRTVFWSVGTRPCRDACRRRREES